jgi:hypothetical protein
VFEEDTGFFAAIKDLSKSSKCPIVITAEKDLSIHLGGKLLPRENTGSNLFFLLDQPSNVYAFRCRICASLFIL